SQQNPKSDSFRGFRRPRWSYDWRWVTARRQYVVAAHARQQQKTKHKRVGRQREEPAGIERTAQIYECYEEKDRQAELQDVGVQIRDRRHKGRYSCRYSDRYVENVVDHECCSRQQAAIHAEVFV